MIKPLVQSSVEENRKEIFRLIQANKNFVVGVNSKRQISLLWSTGELVG